MPSSQQNAERGGGGDDALRAHARLGEAEVDRVIRALGQHPIDRDQVLHARDLGRKDDPIAREADLLRARRREQRRADHRLAHHRARIDRVGAFGVLVHQRGQQFLIERAPVGADPHRLAVADRDLDDRAELRVALVLEADIAGVDAVFVERFGARGMFGQQLMADIVEIADERDVDPLRAQAVADVRHGGGGLVAIDGDADEFRARARQRRDLPRRRLDVGRVGVGHGLHGDRRAAADDDRARPGADPHADGSVPGPRAEGIGRIDRHWARFSWRAHMTGNVGRRAQNCHPRAAPFSRRNARGRRCARSDGSGPWRFPKTLTPTPSRQSGRGGSRHPRNLVRNRSNSARADWISPPCGPCARGFGFQA